MIVLEKKIISFTDEERKSLRIAEDILRKLTDELGENRFDIFCVARKLADIRMIDKFEIDLAQD